MFAGEEREHPVVGLVALEHEVDAEDQGGEEIEEAPHPVGKEEKRYAAVAESRFAERWAMLSTPSLSASGRRLRRATMAGMRAGRSYAN